MSGRRSHPPRSVRPSAVTPRPTGATFVQDAALNDESLINGDRLFSAYGQGQRRFWIITEADGSATTILMPEDY